MSARTRCSRSSTPCPPWCTWSARAMSESVQAGYASAYGRPETTAEPYVEPRWEEVNEDVLRTMLVTGPGYWKLLAVTVTVAIVCFFVPWGLQMKYGLGLSGLNRSANWAVFLSNFIFWI